MGNNTYFWDENVNPLLYRYPGTAGRARAEPQDLQIVERAKVLNRLFLRLVRCLAVAPVSL